MLVRSGISSTCEDLCWCLYLCYTCTGGDPAADPSKYSEKDWFIVRFQAIEAALYSIAIYALISTGETFLKYEYFDIFSANLFFINFLRFFGW